MKITLHHTTMTGAEEFVVEIDVSDDDAAGDWEKKVQPILDGFDRRMRDINYRWLDAYHTIDTFDEKDRPKVRLMIDALHFRRLGDLSLLPKPTQNALGADPEAMREHVERGGKSTKRTLH